MPARPQGAHTKSERRAADARKKRCAIPLKRSKELFQPDAQSDLPLLGPGLRPGRCGWVGSPEGLGRGSRNTLPGPLARRGEKARCREAVLAGKLPLLPLPKFPARDGARLEIWTAAPDSPRCFVRRTRSARQPKLIPIRRATVSRSQLSGMLRLLPATSSRRFSTTRPLTMATVTP